jgi:hypothetical protein
MTELLKMLADTIIDTSINIRFVLPKTPKELSRRLNVLKVPLQSVGIHMDRSKDHSGRIIVLTKVPADSVACVTYVAPGEDQ